MFFSHLSHKINPLKRKILNDPYYRFKNLEEIAIASELGIKIDVNSATIDDWLRLPFFSIHQARLLVELRSNGVQFLSIEDMATALNITPQRLQPLMPILDFCYCDSDSLVMPQKVNINLASREELQTLPLLSSKLIEQIIDHRQAEGKYQNLANFQQRLSLDGQFIAQLMYYIQF